LLATYRDWRRSGLGRITDALEERLICELLGPVHGLRVLDVGCGDGALAVTLAKRGAHVTGADVDPHMLAAAQERARLAQSPVMLVGTDAHALPFKTGACDAIVAITVLCFAPDAAQLIGEMARVLRPGGRMIIGELGRYSVWAAKRRISARFGSSPWRSAVFRSAAELKRLVGGAGLDVTAVRGAIFYPPCGACARWLAPIDAWLGRQTLIGAAFLAVSAIKPDRPGSTVGMTA
jgi:SAM-dependent methyltransferase